MRWTRLMSIVLLRLDAFHLCLISLLNNALKASKFLVFSLCNNAGDKEIIKVP